ncbi:DUF6286 domain-containing protein [Pseudonocardia sp. HH130630-07]|uniref:DUF6286 domain-containing protein n=1 Tax=Pseudonocardia sp. HH130630-07 TaxID=1690815 RepID=UPI000814D1BF|nr:DUF6286 domain-containing protein [Pseudonocardia sp. HH130630-07]ANY05001.1 hypothetical protein AFB00_00145 [Pseudonocardia sp. HH130630-07]
MRVLLRLLAPLVSLAVAALGALVVVEVVAAWAAPGPGAGLLVPWRDWRETARTTLWTAQPVQWIAIAAIVAGAVLLLIGLLARRHDVALRSPSPGLTVTTSPRVLARLVGSRVRDLDPVTSASVTASARSVVVRAGGRGEPTELRQEATTAATAVLEALPLARRPRLTVRAAPDRPDTTRGVH